jgi:hypothetical protein
LEVLNNEDEEATLVNKPMVALVDALAENNLGAISVSNDDKYEYQATMLLDPNNPLLAKLCGFIGGMGTSVSLKGVTFDNPVNGVVLYFDLSDDGKLENFKISTTVNVPIKSVETALTLTYEQKAANTTVSIPQGHGILTAQGDIAQELNTINNAITALKAEDTYSLDIFAENELDPAWNKSATVDSYTGRLYKNTVGTDVWFNHSYKYKAHHEEDGAEAYEYAIGNLQNGEVYEKSFKGKNDNTMVENITVDTQFDYMVAPVLQTAANLDCAKKTVDGTTTTYELYLNETGAIAVQNTILAMINSNPATDVIRVDNHMGSEYTVMDAQIVVEMTNGKITSIKCLTELKYAPVSGDYTEYNVTLKNAIEFQINANLDKAQEYEAPNKVEALFGSDLKSIL